MELLRSLLNADKIFHEIAEKKIKLIKYFSSFFFSPFPKDKNNHYSNDTNAYVFVCL